ncbi:hypothetical protein [Neisseria canis]|uniref:hypothetical protein n=1 Tax=Neisseria canis TaxID=493 RepID=UPI000A18DF84|nr:hypothetical protein [Neisseria canis]OSI12412.1 hypothetical protein BWD07_05475 [Neisseria canis]
MIDTKPVSATATAKPKASGVIRAQARRMIKIQFDSGFGRLFYIKNALYKAFLPACRQARQPDTVIKFDLKFEHGSRYSRKTLNTTPLRAEDRSNNNLRS